MALFIQNIYKSNSRSTITTTASIMDKTQDLQINVLSMFPTGSILWLSTERAGLRLVDATLSETTFHHTVQKLLYA